MKRVLVVVDAQNDFITGSLRNEAAIEVVPKIVKYIKDFRWDRIYVTQDTHFGDYLETNEGRNLPVPHCIANTEGWAIEPSIKAALDEVSTKNKVNVEYITKLTFGSKWLVDYMHLDYDIEVEPFEVVFVGFCTDICVIANAILVKTSFYDQANILVNAQCCAGTTKENHEAALAVMKSCQIEVF